MRRSAAHAQHVSETALRGNECAYEVANGEGSAKPLIGDSDRSDSGGVCSPAPRKIFRRAGIRWLWVLVALSWAAAVVAPLVGQPSMLGIMLTQNPGLAIYQVVVLIASVAYATWTFLVPYLQIEPERLTVNRARFWSPAVVPWASIQVVGLVSPRKMELLLDDGTRVIVDLKAVSPALRDHLEHEIEYAAGSEAR